MFARLTRSPCLVRLYSTGTPPAASLPPVKRIGAFRGGFLGFLGGISVTSGLMYFYLIDEYHNSNTLIMKDVLSLNKSIRVLEEHVKVLEEAHK